MWAEPMAPKEGDLYKELTVAGHDFELRYGYYEEHERELCSPVVIWPDLSHGDKRCGEGFPLVTQVQDPCEHYVPRQGREDSWCGDCIHYTGEHREIGVCRCVHNQQPAAGGNYNE